MPFGQILKAGLKKVLPKKPMATRVDKVTKTIKGPISPQATITKEGELKAELRAIKKERDKILKERDKILSAHKKERVKILKEREKNLKEMQKNLPASLKPQAMGIGSITGAGLNKKEK